MPNPVGVDDRAPTTGLERSDRTLPPRTPENSGARRRMDQPDISLKGGKGESRTFRKAGGLSRVPRIFVRNRIRRRRGLRRWPTSRPPSPRYRSSFGAMAHETPSISPILRQPHPIPVGGSTRNDCSRCPSSPHGNGCRSDADPTRKVVIRTLGWSCENHRRATAILPKSRLCRPELSCILMTIQARHRRLGGCDRAGPYRGEIDRPCGRASFPGIRTFPSW